FHASSTILIYTLSLHDALPIYNPPFTLIKDFKKVYFFAYSSIICWQLSVEPSLINRTSKLSFVQTNFSWLIMLSKHLAIYSSTLDRKSTRLNSSHVKISYAVFC